MLNFEGEGKPLARIITQGKKKAHKVIHVTDDENNVIHPHKVVSCKENETIQYIPNYSSERDVIYVCGKSGSGKTYFTRNFARQYNVVYPDRKIYILSPINDDKSLEGIKNVNYINIFSPEFIEIDLTASDFQNSLIIFDDVDCLKDKLLHRKIDSILTELLQTGRHYNASVVYLSHQACKGAETKSILNECHSITFFLRGLGGKSLKYLLENYLSLDKKQIEQVKKIKSRHITITNTYPSCVMFDKGIYVLE